MPEVPNDIILFWYPQSPYARRVVWFLTLRGIHYAECIQPRILPRPDLLKLGIHYRRIPVLYFRGTVYCDSRLILRVLEEAFPLTDAAAGSTISDTLMPALSKAVSSVAALNPLNASADPTVTAAPPRSSSPSLLSTTSKPTPNPSLSPSHLNTIPLTPPLSALPTLLSHFATDAGVFRAVVNAFPPDGPFFSDDAFLRDREDLLFGVDPKAAAEGEGDGKKVKRMWTSETQALGVGEALGRLRGVFEMVERVLLGGGDWIGGEKCGMADLEAIWPLHWATTIPGLLPSSLISPTQYPKTFAWITRFNALITSATSSSPPAVQLSGAAAIQHILASSLSSAEDVTSAATKDVVDAGDPLGLRSVEEVETFPTDYGMRHRDRGALVRLDGEVAVLSVKAGEGAEGKRVRVAVPRWGFRVARVGGGGAGVNGARL